MGLQGCQLLQSRCYSFEELLSKSGGQRLKSCLAFFQRPVGTVLGTYFSARGPQNRITLVPPKRNAHLLATRSSWRAHLPVDGDHIRTSLARIVWVAFSPPKHLAARFFEHVLGCLLPAATLHWSPARRPSCSPRNQRTGTRSLPPTRHRPPRKPPPARPEECRNAQPLAACPAPPLETTRGGDVVGGLLASSVPEPL